MKSQFWVLAGLVLAGCWSSEGAVNMAFDGEAGARPVVVELFTSQGCSSCPPADRVAESLAEQEGIVVLTLPVDYWDSLGWKDTLASPAYSDRQRRYARAMRRGRGGGVYTPQIVVDGAQAMTGSRWGAVERAVKGARNQTWARGGVDVVLKRGGGTVGVEVRARDTHAEVPLAVVAFCTVDNVEVAIERGENAGRVLNYSRPVRWMASLGKWKGEGVGSYAVKESQMAKAGCDTMVVLVQRAPLGKVFGVQTLQLGAKG